MNIAFSLQVVNGWYYLLGEDVGRRKHMEVQDDARSSLNESRQQLNITSVNKDVLWMDSHTVSKVNSMLSIDFTLLLTFSFNVLKFSITTESNTSMPQSKYD